MSFGTENETSPTFTTSSAIEVTNLSDLPDALEILLHNNDVDVVVARNMAPNQSVCNTIHDVWDMPDKQEAHEIVYREVPVLDEVDQLAAHYWQEKGYTGYTLSPPHMQLGTVAIGGISAHTDFSASFVNPIYGPLSLSLMLKGAPAVYRLQKPPHNFQEADLGWDIPAWKRWKSALAPQELRSTVEQRVGDGVWMMGHPRQTIHAVDVIDDRMRRAAIFDYVARRHR